MSTYGNYTLRLPTVGDPCEYRCCNNLLEKKCFTWRGLYGTKMQFFCSMECLQFEATEQLREVKIPCIIN